MGFFSWRCTVSNKPVMARDRVYGTPYVWANRVVILFRGGNRIYGTYDGYGKINGNRDPYIDLDLMDYREQDWRMVIERYYKGQTFDELTQNQWDPQQGFFYSDEDLEDLFGSAAALPINTEPC